VETIAEVEIADDEGEFKEFLIREELLEALLDVRAALGSVLSDVHGPEHRRLLAVRQERGFQVTIREDGLGLFVRDARDSTERVVVVESVVARV
jgi:hypothetical protein